MNNYIDIPYAGRILANNERVIDYAARVNSLIEREPLAFSKKLQTGHITGSAFIRECVPNIYHVVTRGVFRIF